MLQNGNEYKFLLLLKEADLQPKLPFQETKALLNPASRQFLIEKMKTLGTAACRHTISHLLSVALGRDVYEKC